MYFLIFVFATLQEEICKNEENIEHFHKKSVEIQEMLQSREAPLELQVRAETLLRSGQCPSLQQSPTFRLFLIF